MQRKAKAHLKDTCVIKMWNCMSSGLTVHIFPSCFFLLHTCRSAELLQHCLTVSCPRVAISSLPLDFFLAVRCGEKKFQLRKLLSFRLYSAWGFLRKPRSSTLKWSDCHSFLHHGAPNPFYRYRLSLRLRFKGGISERTSAYEFIRIKTFTCWKFSGSWEMRFVVTPPEGNGGRYK